MLKALPGLLGTSGGDATAPTITSSSAFTVNEGQDFETTLTANEAVTWWLAGGADQARFMLTGSTLSMTARNFESPQDADDDNRYEVLVRATDANANYSEQTIIVTVLDVVEGGGSADPDRTYGVDYTPDYVTNWLGPWLDNGGSIRLPATLAAGIADGRIPADAIDYSTGNGGGAFANYDAWVAAMLAQDKPGALGVDIAPATMTASYLARGIYGYGSSMPKITFPTRTTARWNLYKYDLTFRGIEFVNYGTALRASRPLVPLTVGGVVDTTPYHYTSTGDSWPHFGNATVNNMFRRVAIFSSVSNAGNITQIYIKRRPVNGVNPSAATWAAWNAIFEGGPDNFPVLLGGSVANATPASLAQAINDYTATSGFTAEAVGSDVLLFNANAYKEALYFDVDCTGALDFECCGPGIDISCCKFTDGNSFLGCFLDTIAFGQLRIMKNVGVGSWGLANIYALRKSVVQVACNEWSDAHSSRPAATGRTNSRMPSGSNTSQYNTIIGNGSNTFTMTVFGYSREWYENNYFHDIESINNTDTNNCVVAFDIRCNTTDFYLDGISGGSLSVSWNKLVNLVGTQGAEDCNAIYAKPRGGTFSNNYIENCGAAWKSDGAFDGSEGTGMVIKEGRANFGMPQLIVERNVFANMPHGIPMLKVDNQYNLIVRYNHFKNWRNARNGVTQTNGASSGAMRITGFMAYSHLHSNYFENIELLGQPMGLNVHNVNLQATSANNNLAIHNNVFQNDGTANYAAYTTDTVTMRFNAGTNGPANPTTFFNSAVMGYNLVNNAAGADVGVAQLRYTNNNSIQVGSDNATYDPFDSDTPPPEEPTNVAPTDIALSSTSIAESASVGDAVGTLSATDADAGETFTFTLTDSASRRFSITGTSLLVASALDYETATSHSITVRVTDSASNTFDKNFTITVTDVDETPPAGDYEAEADALFAAMSVQPSTDRKNLYNDLIVSLKNAGVWAKLDALYLMAAHDEQAACLNLVDPGNNTITYGGTTPTYTTDQGFTTNGTNNYLDTNFNPATASGNFTQNSALFGVWSLTTAGAPNSWAGWYDGTDGITISGRNSSINRYEWRINQTSPSSTSNNTSTSGKGFFVTTRTSSTAAFIYKNGTFVASSSPTSTALNSHDLYLGSVTASSFAAIEFAACVVGSGFTNSAGEQTALYNALQAYMTGVGVT